MALTGTLVTLAASALITGYLFYALNPVPADIEQGDDVFWIFARRKYTRALSIVGEYLHLGHRINLTRYLSSTPLLTLNEPASYRDIKITKTSFDGVEVNIYEPENRVDNSPALVWFHGGGWVLGNAETDEFFMIALSKKLQIPVVSVNYRLGPEHVFPAAFDDCYAVVKYFLDNAKTFGVDPKRIAIGGASAGGNLAAAVSLKLRDVKHPLQPSHQILFVPCLQAFDFSTPSYQTNTDSGFLPLYWMVNYWLWYAHGPRGHERNYEYMENQHTSPSAKMSPVAKRVDHNLLSRKYIDSSYVPNAVNFGNESLWKEIEEVFVNPYFAPLMASDLTGLPDAYVATAGWDVLRDDGLMYAKRLADSGVEVESRLYENGFHALYMWLDHFNLSKKVFSDLVQYLSTKL